MLGATIKQYFSSKTVRAAIIIILIGLAQQITGVYEDKLGPFFGYIMEFLGSLMIRYRAITTDALSDK